MASKFYTLLESMINRINSSIKNINGITPDDSGAVTIFPPRNLLDNTDFLNPINQDGLSSYSGEGYTIDRWKCMDSSGTLTIENGIGITTGGAKIRQIIEPNRIDPTKTYTLVARMYSQGNYYTNYVSGTFASTTSNSTGTLSFGYDSEGDFYYVDLAYLLYFVWVALYEGEYTADNTPVYSPKGWAAEISECHRYYRIINYKYPLCSGLSTSEMYFNVELGNVPMRSKPIVTMTTPPTKAYVGSTEYTIAIDTSTVEIQQFSTSLTHIGVYAKSTKTAEYMKMRPTCVNEVGFKFDARP